MGRRKQGKYPYTHIPLAVEVPTLPHFLCESIRVKYPIAETASLLNLTYLRILTSMSMSVNTNGTIL
jgi:hypothetical protein